MKLFLTSLSCLKLSLIFLVHTRFKRIWRCSGWLVVSFASDYASWSHNKSSRWLETVIHLWMSIFLDHLRHFLTLQKEVFVMMMKWKLLSIIFVNWTLSTQFGYLFFFFLLLFFKRWRSSFKCCWPHLLNYIVMCSLSSVAIHFLIFIPFKITSSSSFKSFLSLSLSFVWCDIKAKSRFCFFLNSSIEFHCQIVSLITKRIFFSLQNYSFDF